MLERERRPGLPLQFLKAGEYLYRFVIGPVLFLAGVVLIMRTNASWWWAPVAFAGMVGSGVAFQTLREHRERAARRAILRMQLAREPSLLWPVMEKLGQGEPITQEESDLYNGAISGYGEPDEIWQTVADDWRAYAKIFQELKAREEKLRAARRAKAEAEKREAAERERAEREARKRAYEERKKREDSANAGRATKSLTPYEAALQLLKLREGHFSRSDFNKHYRRAMQAAHPDAGGSTAQAQAVNAARDLIRKRHAWK